MSLIISIIDVLREVVDKRYIHSDNSALITLTESQQNTCGPITLQKTVGIKQVLVIDTDLTGADIHPFLTKSPVKNLRKKVDYLMFCELEKKDGTLTTYIFPIELKSRTDQDWQRQAKAGCTFAKYLVSFVEVKEKVNFDLSEYGNKVEYRCVLFSNQPRALTKKPKLKATPMTYKEHAIYQYKYCRKKCGKRYFLKAFIN